MGVRVLDRKLQARPRPPADELPTSSEDDEDDDGGGGASNVQRPCRIGAKILLRLLAMDYQLRINLYQAAHFGVAQSRVRLILVATKRAEEL